MRQVVQNLSSGATELVEAPAPLVADGAVLIRSHRTLISAGTERMLVDFGRASMISKARQQPERVREVLNKVRTDGLMTTVDAVRAKLGQPLPLGYCNVGTVVAIGKGVQGISVGDRVASNGPHADVVSVPRNLCAHVPDNVEDEAAAFTVLASIGLQGIRLAQPTLGETFVVTGVGLIGLITVQLLIAQGCRVLAIDFDEAKLALAASYGAETCNPGKGGDPVSSAMAFSRGRGVDGVLVTASTASSEPMSQAARMCRKRGRIVLVGVTGLELNRADFYEKELSFQVSCSYGPGRYDPSYEQGGNDYPLGFVRWTEQRNFEAVLDMLSQGRLAVDALISHRIPFDEAPSAYDRLTEDKSALGILLVYPQDERALQREVRLTATPAASTGAASSTDATLGVIGAGNYASRVLIPAFKANGGELRTVVTAGGLNSVLQGRSLGFETASSDVDAMLADPTVASVAIVTRHDSHADLTNRALRAGKHVMVEKPLALDLPSLDALEATWKQVSAADPQRKLMVGFNRRFAPHIVKMKQLLDGVAVPKAFVFTVNAGDIPANHWTQDLAVGGGRIIGEGCHFIDLMRFLANSPIESWTVQQIGRGRGVAIPDDKVSITLSFADGSFGTIHYLANGSNAFPKERIEVFAAGRVLQIDNYRKMRGFGWPGFSKMNLWNQDKGQKACAGAFLDAVRSGGPAPISAEELFEVSRVTIEIAGAVQR